MVTGGHLKKWLDAQDLGVLVIECKIVGEYRPKITRLFLQKGTVIYKLDVHQAVTYMGDSHRQALVDKIKSLPVAGPNQYWSFESNRYDSRWKDEVDRTWAWTEKKFK